MPDANVVKEQVPAQVAPAREPDADKVEVYETSVELDEVITDPTSELAVQVPEEGRGSLELPTHALANEDGVAQSPEEALESGDAPEFERAENVDGPSDDDE